LSELRQSFKHSINMLQSGNQMNYSHRLVVSIIERLSENLDDPKKIQRIEELASGDFDLT
jgi:hypothetical protein